MSAKLGIAPGILWLEELHQLLHHGVCDGNCKFDEHHGKVKIDNKEAERDSCGRNYDDYIGCDVSDGGHHVVL